MIITSRNDLNKFLCKDSHNYRSQIGSGKLRNNLQATPISEQKYIWKYIYALRHAEYHHNNNGCIHKLLKYYWFCRLRKLSHITGFQIALNSVGPGMTIWHFGSVIINPFAKIGANATLYPGVLVGWKSENSPAPRIGNNVFIGSGAKIIGDITIGDNVVIGQNCVIVKDVPSDTKIVLPECRVLS